jgi:hypothetical protein
MFTFSQNVSQSFLLIMTYFMGEAMHKFLPSRGVFRYINPGPWNIKEHGFTLIMCSTAAGSAIAVSSDAIGLRMQQALISRFLRMS